MKRHLKHKGIAIIWVAITLLAVVGIMALMLNAARIYLTSHQLQSTADAASLVGARYVAVLNDPNYPNAREIAYEYALLNRVLGDRDIQLDLNESNDPAGEIVIGRYLTQNAKYNAEHSGEKGFVEKEVFVPTLDTPNAMKVFAGMGNSSLNNPLPMLWGSIFFKTSPKNLSRYAIAVAYNSYGAGLLATAPEGRGLYVHGNITLNVDGGAIQVNSADDYEAIYFQGNSLNILSENINVYGELRESGFDATEDVYYHDIESTLTTGVPPIPDPYANLPEPPVDRDNDLSPIDPNTGLPMAIKVSTGEVVNLSPGYYSRGITMVGGTVNLLPGIYNLGGDMTVSGSKMVTPNGGLSMTGGTLNATESLIHIVDNGRLYVGGNGTINMTPLASGPYEGFSIFQSRDLNNNGLLDNCLAEWFKATIIGTSGSNLEGILYFPQNLLYTEGGGASMRTQLVAYQIEIGGNGEVIINYNGSPRPADNSYLVE